MPLDLPSDKSCEPYHSEIITRLVYIVAVCFLLLQADRRRHEGRLAAVTHTERDQAGEPL